MSYHQTLQGITAIAVTPFESDGRIDHAAFESGLAFLEDGGMPVIVVGGNTGEYYSLERDELEDLISAGCESLKQASVMAGVGGSLESAIDMARHAEARGCDSVMVHNPPHPFLSAAGFHDYIKGIADSVSIAVIPYLRSPAIDQTTILALQEIPNVCGIKYAINDLQALSELIVNSQREDHTWICGTAESWAPFFYTAGCLGYTSGLVNVAPKLSLDFHEKLNQGQHEEAMFLWNLMRPFEKLREKNHSADNVAVVKAAMEIRGLGPGHLRSPGFPVDAQIRDEIASILNTWEKAGY